MQIASAVLEGELAARNKEYDSAIRLLSEAITIENGLRYNEPPDWFFPVRHNLGAVLLQANKPGEAEIVYRQDLKKFPENGWSLLGLHESLLAQGRTEEARKVRLQFDKAWKYADIKPGSSRIL